MLLVVLAVIWLPEGLLGAEAGKVAVGSRIRVTSEEAGSQPIVGQVVALEPGAVVLSGEGGVDHKRILIVPSTTLEVSTGKKSQAGRGAMAGAAVGAMPGLLMTTGDYNTDKGNPAAVSLGGAAAGAVIGSLVGLMFKQENWLPADMPVVAAGIAPIPRGAAVSLRLEWGGCPRSRRQSQGRQGAEQADEAYTPCAARWLQPGRPNGSRCSTDQGLR
jgi:hypothetical protein